MVLFGLPLASLNLENGTENSKMGLFSFFFFCTVVVYLLNIADFYNVLNQISNAWGELIFKNHDKIWLTLMKLVMIKHR